MAEIPLKAIRLIRLAGDGLVTPTPAFLFSVTITSDGGGDADAKVYDGVSTKAPQVLDLGAYSGDLRQVSFNPPAYFRRGIYVDVGSNVASVSLQYATIRE